MWLTDHQIAVIQSTAREIWGGQVRLFGSRVKDSRRGGDIDWMQYKIQPALRECDAHQQRLHRSVPELERAYSVLRQVALQHIPS